MPSHGSRKAKTSNGDWDAVKVRALRKHLGTTQQQMAEELGTRQQTVSEWETGLYQPRGASRKLLSIIAERANFRYSAGREAEAQNDGESGNWQ